MVPLLKGKRWGQDVLCWQFWVLLQSSSIFYLARKLRTWKLGSHCGPGWAHLAEQQHSAHHIPKPGLSEHAHSTWKLPGHPQTQAGFLAWEPGKQVLNKVGPQLVVTMRNSGVWSKCCTFFQFFKKQTSWILCAIFPFTNIGWMYVGKVGQTKSVQCCNSVAAVVGKPRAYIWDL